MCKTKYFSAFEQVMVVGARHTGLSVSRTATLKSVLCVSKIVHHPKDMMGDSTQRTPNELRHF
jgi:hypothetical protein